MATVVGRNSRGGLKKVAEPKAPREIARFTNTAGQKVQVFNDGSKVYNGTVANPGLSTAQKDAIGAARGDEFAPAFEAAGGVKNMAGRSITETLDIRAGQGGGSSSPTTASRVSSPSTAGSTKSGGYSKSNPTGAGGYEGRYSRYGLGDEPTLEEPNYDQIQKDLMKDAQKEINSLNNLYSQKLEEQKTINAEQDRATSSINTLTGLAGSTEANQNVAKTKAQGQKALDQIRAQQQVELHKVFSAVRADAREMFTTAKDDYRQDVILDQAKQEKAQQNAMLLAKSGATLEGLKQTDQKTYDYLAKSVGGEEMLKAVFTLNRPQDTIVDKKMENGKYVVAWQNPLTGAIKIDTVDLGLPPQYTKTIDAGDRILAIPDGWSGDPGELITINKGMTPAQRGTAGTGGSGTYGSDLDALIGATKATITSKFGQQTFSEQISRARNEADKINLIASVVLGKADSQTKTDFANQAVGMRQIDKAINLLDEGVKTGFLQDKAQYAFNVFGKDFDPKLAQMNQLITSAIQPYRNSVTGAAWGEQEDGEYGMLFGDTHYSPAELKQRLLGVKEILASKSATALNVYVNPMGYYDNPFQSGDYSNTDLSNMSTEELERIANGG